MSQVILPSEYRSEFVINPDGTVTATRRATARLAGVDPTQLYHASRDTGLLKNLVDGKNLSKVLEPFTGRDFRGDGNFLPDVIVAAIIQHYAFKGNETAQLTALAFSAVGIRTWLHTQLGSQQPSPPNSSLSTLDEINIIFAGLQKLSIKPELVESAKLTAIAKTLPHLRSAAEEGKKLLSSQMTIPQLPMSPTELGKILAAKLGLPEPISPRRINEALTEAGLQTAETIINKKGQKKIQYKLTDTGEKYGQLQLDSAANHGKTIMIVRWHETVLKIIQSQLTDA
ncbi:hypothetical protein [Gloeothece verrucosa]|uniref:Uncharacterized protein n=1 Tax=Gloeothece verrucosa (strain PCC 7822) TaxID=497965 RepID=E0UEN2_GLOV7|nr:hypothetical protein [Gloeothece verrucosa]ADN16600.1 hypothetical protein Cyan7822_4695 [Gloeothece verrucosa PCC 7822]